MASPPGLSARALFSALTLLATVALLFLPRPGSASCENIIEAQSRELWFIYNDIYPVPRDLPRTPEIDSLYLADLRSMWDAMARGLATAAACQRRIDADPRLAALLSESQIRLQMAPGGPIRRAWEPDQSRPSTPDSVFALFEGLVQDSTGLVYTIRIGSFADSISAHRLFVRLAWLNELREGGPDRDSALVLDWKHESCSIGEYERPTLFVLPPAISETRRWTVLSGLFLERADAIHWFSKVRGRGGRAGEVIPIRVTGDVLRFALPPR